MPVYKNKTNSTWYVKFKNKTRRGFKTKKEAQNYEAKMKLSMIHNVETCDIYFDDVAKDYLKTLYINTRYATYQKAESAINNIILPNIEIKKISSISEIDCRKFKEYISSLSYSTTHKNYILNKYKAIYKHAILYFKLQRDPSTIITMFQPTHEEKLRKRNKETNIWTMDEFYKFINYVEKPVYKVLFTLLFLTGMRLGECLALNWHDLDIYRQVIHITKSLTRKTEYGTYAIGDTKNFSSIRDISLGNELTTYLIEFKKQESLVSGFSDDWFILGRNKPLPQTSIDRIKNQAIKKSGVKKIKIHDFRHSHASYLIANGMNIVAVSKRLGHSDVNMTLKVYTHLFKKNDEEITDFLDKSSQNLLNK